MGSLPPATRRVLVVEDEFLIAAFMAEVLEDLGFIVVGPANSVSAAIGLLDTEAAIDAATLDINLRGELAFPIADRLQSEGVPFVFTSGYDCENLPDRFATVRLWLKPVDPLDVVRSLFR